MDQNPTRVSSRACALPALCAALRRAGYDFVTVTPATHRSVNARPENYWARDLRGVFGWSRPFRQGVLDPVLFQLANEAGVIEPVLERGEAGWRSRVRASTLEGLIFLHSAFPTDGAEAVFFGPDTYRFAASVRHLMDGRRRAVRRGVDIGCGSGAAGILVALANPEAEVILADINRAALELAEAGGNAAGVRNIACVESDLFENLDGAFDLVVANPPYLIDAAARTYRHGGGQLGEGLSLRILRQALPRLAPGGQLLLYTGSAIADGHDFLREAAGAILAGTGWAWDYREMDPDVFGEELAGGAYTDSERIAAVVLTVERPA